jgi:hypothetical protein
MLCGEQRLILPEFSGPGMEPQLKRDRRRRKRWQIISTMSGLHEFHIKLEVTAEWAPLNREAGA